MIQLSDLIGHDTMDITNATPTGRVSGIGLAANRIAAVGVDGGTIDANAVQSFDGDVMTHHGRSDTELSGLPTPFDPRGTKVLDRHGDLLGTIADLLITDDGVVDSIVLDDGSAVLGSRLQAIGSYAAVVTTAPVG